MKALLNYLVDLCLLRAAPQDLPASSSLLILFTLLNMLVSLVMIVGTRLGFFPALLESFFEVVLMFSVLYVGLKYRGGKSRFLQSASALMGSGLLLGLAALPLVTWSQRSDSTEAGLLLLVLVIWSLVVMGHILRHTFDIRFNLGLGLALLYTMIAWNLTFKLFPVVT